MQRIWITAAAIVAILALSLTWIGADQIAVRESYGGKALVLNSGLHFRVFPFHRIYRYSRASLNFDEALEIVTRDKATFKLPVRIAARISAGDLLTFHAGCSGGDPGGFIEETVRDAVRDAASGMNADEILTPGTAALLGQVVSSNLITRGISDDGLELGRLKPRVLFNAVIDYLNRNFTPSARRLTEAVLAAEPKEPMFHAALGTVFEAEGNRAEAEQAYLESLFLSPAAPEPMSRLYLLYQTSSDPKALGRLQRLLGAAIEKNPDSPLHHDWLGQVHMRQGHQDHAEEHFESAIRLAPRTPEFHISLGGLRVRQGQIPEARTAYEAALGIDPNHALALFNIGTTYGLENDLEQAIQYLQRAEQAGPPNHAVFNALAQAYENQGDQQRAADYLRRSLALLPDQPDRQAALKRIEAKIRKQG